jgi:phosphatidate cytidylyltransferase
MQRLATALLMVPLALAALFLLDGPWFFLVVLGVFELAAWEVVAIGRLWTPGAPRAALPLLLAVASVVLAPGVALGRELPEGAAICLAFLLTGGVGALVLIRRTPVAEALPTMGLLAFGALYLAVPVASLARLQLVDPWLVLLLFAVVWLGDTAAYYVGRRWGRRLLAPVVSPKKTWEGAGACLAAALASAVVWSLLRDEGLDLPLVVLAGLTSVAAQVGDLVESLYKRAAGRKDSGAALPGHGGWLDRLDAMIFAAPVFWLGLAALGRIVGP